MAKKQNVITDPIRIGAAYIRVSTDGQMDLSPESQLDSILDYAKSHNIVIPKEYIFMESEGRSGKKAENRPQFQRMIATAKGKPKPFDCILVWKFSRFARNQDESTFYKGMLRKKLSIDVISISEPVLDGMYGRLIEMIIEWQDEFYSYNLAQDVTRGMKTKAENGGYQCRPPLGYRIPYHKATPEIVPEEAEIVRLIFDKYVNEKMSIYALTRYLNSLGLKTNRGNPFEKRSLEYILQNPSYAGRIRWNRTRNETKEVKDKSEWILSQGHHPAIISEELFDQAIKRYESEYKRKNAKPSEVTRHWLSGLLKCSSCGRTLSSCVRHRKNTTDNYSFQCYGYLKGKCTVNHYVAEKDIVPSVLGALKEVLKCGTVRYEVKNVVKTEDNHELDTLKNLLQKLNVKEKRARDAYMDGIDTKEEYRQNKLLLQKERDGLNASIAQLLQSRSTSAMDEADQTKRILNNIQNVMDILESDSFTMVQKNVALKSIVDKIVFNRDNMHIDIYYYLTEES
jgi:DNA invertase Pin-like site-specific DNA recombinase